VGCACAVADIARHPTSSNAKVDGELLMDIMVLFDSRQIRRYLGQDLLVRVLFYLIYFYFYKQGSQFSRRQSHS
jgi:hypothetical protein